MSEKSIERVDRARQEGIDLTIAQYPYIAGSTMLHAVIPPWYHSREPNELIQMLKEERQNIKQDIRDRRDWDNHPAAIGWNNVVVSSVETDANQKFVGRSITEIASMRGLEDPADAALDLLAEEELAVGMITFYGDEGDVVRIMRHPSMSVITDGLLGGKPHPRVYGTFPRLLGRYVREQKVMSIEEAVRKMTSNPAQKLRLKNKGLIAENYDADLTVFDPEQIIDRATYEDPRQFSVGVNWVIVNGEVVVAKGVHTGARPGRVIR